MPTYSLWALGASNITVTGGNGSLSGFNQGNGSNLNGATITLNNNSWEEMTVTDNDANFNDSDNNQRLQGNQTFDGVSYSGNNRVEAEYTVTVSDGVNTYTLIAFNINESGSSFPSYGTVEGLAFVGSFPPIGVPLTVVSTSEGPGGSTTPFGGYAEPICFTPGARLKTPDGLRAIEDLEVGDLVTTEDDGPQPIRWIGTAELDRAALASAPFLSPIRIEQGALGDGRPFRTMDVSPQHRFVIRNPLSSLHFGIESSLIPARHLINNQNIYQRFDASKVTYIHLLLDAHHVILAEGCRTETLHLTERRLDMMSEDAQRELNALFPDIARVVTQTPPARETLKRWESAFLAHL